MPAQQGEKKRQTEMHGALDHDLYGFSSPPTPPLRTGALPKLDQPVLFVLPEVLALLLLLHLFGFPAFLLLAFTHNNPRLIFPIITT